MIVCSCNQLTDRQVLDSLTGDVGARPRSPGQVYLCLGCKPDCGRCVTQIRQMFSDITSGDACQIGCAVCPGEAAHAAARTSTPSPAAAPAPAWQTGNAAPRRQFVVPEAQRFSATRPCSSACSGNGREQTDHPAASANDDGDLGLIAAE